MSVTGIISEPCPCLLDKAVTGFTPPNTQVPMHPVEKSDHQSSLPVLAIFATSLFCAAVLLLIATPLYAEDQSRITSLRSGVFALSSARQTALHELESLPLSAGEVTDYKDFIVYLNTRITNDCRELAEQGGAAALEGLTCPDDSMASGASKASVSASENIFYTTGPGTAPPQTQAEKTAELDGGFLADLGEFDEMLLKEEEKIAARVPSQRESSSNQSGAAGSHGASTGAGETGAGDGGETGELAEASEGGTADGQEGQSETVTGPQSHTGAGSSDIDHTAYGAPGGTLPPPKDDDIVARQLREAANKEPDPELKKKLWEEYWRYKGVNK
jgi:hypothetical protein